MGSTVAVRFLFVISVRKVGRVNPFLKVEVEAGGLSISGGIQKAFGRLATEGFIRISTVACGAWWERIACKNQTMWRPQGGEPLSPA